MAKAKTPGKTTARIADALRAEIVSGRLKPGAKLPTVNQLIKDYGVSRTSVVHAMRVLEGEGLVSPEVGRGTFVRERGMQGEIAVVLSRDLLTVQASPYYQMVASRIMAGIKSISPRCRGRLHLASMSGRYNGTWPELDLLEDDVLPQLAGVFTFHRLFGIGDELARRGVPIVSMSNQEDRRPSVYLDRTTGCRLALEHLREAGARNIAVFSVKLPGFPFYARWTEVERIAAEVGVSVTSVVGTVQTLHAGDAEQIGQSLFHDFIDRAERPDAVYVSDDVLCRGVLWAAMQRGVRFPDDMLLISFSNKDVPFPSPQPITRVEYEPAALAVAALERMRQQAEANPQQALLSQLIPPRLIIGETTGSRHIPSSEQA